MWNFIISIINFFKEIQSPAMPMQTPPANTPKPPLTPVPLPKPDNIEDDAMLWNSPQNARHSVRVLCDRAGMAVGDKNVLCAVIGGESGWTNTYPNGKPVVHLNKNAAGKVSSTDWGICQVNDYWHIGPRKDFPSVDYVMKNPEEVVKWMIKMYDAGLIKLWDAYLNGSYKKFL